MTCFGRCWFNGVVSYGAMNFQRTKIACYLGLVTQAITANFAPLLFLKFHGDYAVSLGNIALIATFFFLYAAFGGSVLREVR